MRRRVSKIALLVLLVVSIGGYNQWKYGDMLYLFRPALKVETLVCYSDMDGDGLDDKTDIVEGARLEVKNHTTYRSEYYQGGYPPEDEGVCTDVIWRAFKHAGYLLKDDMDQDIAMNTHDYPRINQPDPNIDFRRVKNQHQFFKKYMDNLTTQLIPYDKENLKEWQGGDIIILSRPDHIAVISNKRRKDGVPYVIHNAYDYPREEDKLLSWQERGKIIGHFRFKYKTVS